MVYKNIYIPSFFTLLNFFWGFFSIVKTVEGDFHAAAWFIILAVLCDGMDGKLARWMNSDTAFGFELDSLADVVSSGMAPALLVYIGGLTQEYILGIIFCFIYFFAGGYRLARFNIIQAGDRSRGYIGLPIPVAGMSIASLWLFQSPLGQSLNYIWWITLLIFLSVLMVSTISYNWPTLIFKGKWWKVIQSIAILSATVIMAVFPERALFPIFLFYIILGVRKWVAALYRREVALTEFFIYKEGISRQGI